MTAVTSLSASSGPALSAKKELFKVISDSQRAPGFVVVFLMIMLWGGGVSLLVMEGGGFFTLLAVPFISLALIWALYLAHDCAHFLVFKHRPVNIVLGEVLSVLNGLAYTSFNEYRQDHIRHHSDKVDLVGVDVAAFLEKLPVWLAWSIIGLEAIYIPALFYMFKFQTIVASLKAGGKARYRVSVCLALYGALFFWVASASVVSLLLLFVASFIRIHVVRFVDAFQHSYEQIIAQVKPVAKTRDYELRNTFSVPVARKWTWLNLLILNFGYHKAHHALPSCPWYLLPTVEQKMVQMNAGDNGPYTDAEAVFSFVDLLVAYHRFRIARIFTDDEGTPYNEQGELSLQTFTGAFTDKLLG